MMKNTKERMGIGVALLGLALLLGAVGVVIALLPRPWGLLLGLVGIGLTLFTVGAAVANE